MSSSQHLLILGGMATCQIIAMALPYWMGLQAGRLSLGPLQDEIEQLRRQLSVEGETSVTLKAEGASTVESTVLVNPVSQGVSYV